MTIIDKSGKRIGATFTDDIKTVVVHDGSRGPQGIPGKEGDPGDPGASIIVRGEWNMGTEYCPLDAVRWRSSLVEHVYSLYVQRSDQPCAPSTIPPNEDQGRWEEIGPYEWGNYLGGIWEVEQLNHGFTKIGQPVGYSFQADMYVLADCRRLDELAVAVVREVKDANRVVLQSSGEVPNIDETVIWPDGQDWKPGFVYYVSTVRGRLEETPPADPQYLANPILMPSDVYAPDGGTTGRNGIALPWTPSGGSGSADYVPVGWTKFYFTAVGGETSVSGPDDNGRTLAYYVGENTDVFLNGLNLVSGTEFQATDGVVITFTEALLAGDIVEIWTPDRPLDLLVPSTIVKLDNIEGLFNGVTTQFPLRVGAADVQVQSTLNCLIWLDVNPQEALVDYILVEDPAQPGSGIAVIEFTAAPPQGTRFWGLLAAPTSGAASTPPGGDTDQVLAKNSGTDGDADWKASVLSADAQNYKISVVAALPGTPDPDTIYFVTGP